jgi:hypothetical protein
MTMVHTPGPWTAKTWIEKYPHSPIGEADSGYWFVEGGCGYNNKDGSGVEVSQWLTEANAKLIAAAPDLLAALIEARTQLEAFQQEATGEDYNSLQINAAIAKAIGQ